MGLNSGFKGLMHVIIQHFDIGFSSQWALDGRDWFRDTLFNKFNYYVAGLLLIHDKQMVAQQPSSIQYSRNK